MTISKTRANEHRNPGQSAASVEASQGREEFRPIVIPEGLTDQEVEAFKRKHSAAIYIQARIGSIYLQPIIGDATGSSLPADALSLYFRNLLEQAGSDSDPIERILIEEIALAHHAIGRLYVRAARAGTPEIDKLYSQRATDHLRELRHTILVLAKYRQIRSAIPGMPVAQSPGPRQPPAASAPAARPQPTPPREKAGAAEEQLPESSPSAVKPASGKLKSAKAIEPAPRNDMPLSHVPSRNWGLEPRSARKPERKGSIPRTKREPPSPARKAASKPLPDMVSCPRVKSDRDIAASRKGRKPK